MRDRLRRIGYWLRDPRAAMRLDKTGRQIARCYGVPYRLVAPKGAKTTIRFR